MIGFAAVAILLPNWPLIEWQPPKQPEYVFIQNPKPPQPGYYYVPARLLPVIAAEVVLVGGYILLRRIASRHNDRSQD